MMILRNTPVTPHILMSDQTAQCLDHFMAGRDAYALVLRYRPILVKASLHMAHPLS